MIKSRFIIGMLAIYSNLVFRFETFGAHFRMWILCIFMQFSKIGNKFWIIFTYCFLIIKNGWIRKFVYFHFELFWRLKKLFYVFGQIGPIISYNAKVSKIIDILVNVNSDVVNKSPVTVLTKVNIKIKMDHAKFCIKTRSSKSISFKTWF